MDQLLTSADHLRRNFISSIFASATVNFGPRTVCFPHADYNNLPFGLCAVTALGHFNHRLGGHLTLWPLRLVVEFPPASTVLIPSAIIEHSNTTVGPGEQRHSFTQYSAGGLFRWVEHGFQTNDRYYAGLSEEEICESDKRDKARWALGLELYPIISSKVAKD